MPGAELSPDPLAKVRARVARLLEEGEDYVCEIEVAELLAAVPLERWEEALAGLEEWQVVAVIRGALWERGRRGRR